MQGAFSGTLLDADLQGSAAPPSFLGTATGAGAAADPAAFLVGSPESDLHGADGGSYGFVSGGYGGGLQFYAGNGGTGGEDGGGGLGSGTTHASASDLLRQLELGCDFLLPTEPLDIPVSMMEGPSGGGHCLPPMATSPGTPPVDASSQAWPSLAFPSIPEEAELLPQAAAPHGAALQPLPGLAVPASGFSSHTTAAAAAAPQTAQPASFAHQLQPSVPQAVPQAPPLFVPVPAPLAAASPPAPAPPAPRLFSGGPVTTGAGGSTSHSEATSAATSPTSSSGHPAFGERSGSGASGRRTGVPRPASMPNLHLSLAETSGGAVRKKAAARPASRARPAPRAIPRSQSHHDFRSQTELQGSSSTENLTAAAVVAATPAAADPAHLPHVAFLTPVHKRKGKGGRQPAADPRLDPNMDPKKAARIMANRLSAAKSKMRQKAQVERQKVEGVQEEAPEDTAMEQGP